MLKRWPAFARFLDDGRICLSNNAAERALRGIAIGRRAWLFAGSDRGGERAAAMFSLIETAKLNGVDPQAWLADVLRRIQMITRPPNCTSYCPGIGSSPSPNQPRPDRPNRGTLRMLTPKRLNLTMPWELCHALCSPAGQIRGLKSVPVVG
jgi:hypothetical protein